MERNNYLDGMMGLVTADAFGSPCQFRDREEFTEHKVTEMIPCEGFGMPAGCFTDDSSLALALLDSLKELGYVDVVDIAERSARWLKEGEYTPFGRAYDIGMGCMCGIRNFLATGDPKGGPDGERDNGNGSLMKILPLCIFFAEKQKSVCTSEDECIQAIHDVSAITHGHIRAQMGCGLYYFMVKHIINDRDKKSLRQCLQDGIDEGMDYYARDLRNLVERSYYGRLYETDELARTPESEIITSGYVVHTLEAAVWNLITTSDYRECIIQTVNLGGDADTVGAVAGGLAGLYYGYESIPEEWLSALVRREWIEEMCRR